MDNTLPELEQAQILLAHKQADRIKQISSCLAQIHNTEIRITVTDSIDDTVRELESARFDLVLCDRRLLTVKLIEQFNRLRSRGEPAATVLLSNDADDQTRNIGRAIAALDAVPLNHVNEDALAHYIHIALRLGATQHLDNQATQVLNAVGSFGDVFFYRGRFDEEVMTVDWLSHSFSDFTGYPGRDYLGIQNGFRALVKDTDLPIYDQWIGNIRNNHRSVSEFRIVDELGRERWLEAKGQPIWSTEQQAVSGILGRARDVTQRRALEDRTKNLSNYQGFITEFSNLCSSANDINELVRAIPKLIARACPSCDVCGIFLRKGRQFTLAGSHRWKLNAPSDRFLPVEISNELNFTLQQGEAVLINNLPQEQRFTPSHILMANNVKSGVCFPMSRDQIEAVLCLYSKSSQDYEEDELAFLSTLTDLLSHELTKTQSKEPAPAPSQDSQNNSSSTSHVIEQTCQQLLSASSWQQNANNVLQKIGQAFGSTHALIYDLEVDLDNTILWGHRYEWAHTDKTPYSKIGATKYYELQDEELEEDIISGDPVLVSHADNGQLTKLFQCQQIFIAPIIIHGSCWGCVMLVNDDSSWQEDDFKSMSIFTAVLSTLIQKQRAERRMREVIEGTASTTGPDFYNSLVEHMAKALRVDFCQISQLNFDQEKLDVVACWEEGELAQPFSQSLEDSPGARAIEGDLVYYPEDVQSLHPADSWLTQNEIQGYLSTPIISPDGVTLGLLSIMHKKPMDVSESDLRVIRLFADRAAAEMEREHIETENRALAAVPKESPSPFIRFLTSGAIEYTNPACDQLCSELKLDSADQLLPDENLRIIEQALETPGRAIQAEQVIDSIALEWHYYAQTNKQHIQAYAIDITSHREEEEQLRKDAFHDHLTGLPNRAFFKNLLTHSLEKTQRDQFYHFAILFLDLDRFKIVNDSLGHDAGDHLLEEIASRLVETVRPGDYVARFGGDEFAILLDGISDVHAASDIAAKIQRELQKPIQLDNHESFTSASIGIAFSDRDYSNIEDVIRNADAAMYHAKNNGKAQHAIFNSDMHDQAVHMLQLETDLRKSIENQELKIHYQPIVDISQDKLVGFEALVRWQHPKQGLMFPDDFIPLAEETGFIRELDRWMLDNATVQLQDWRGSIDEAENLQLSLNLSGLHFDNMEILSHIGNLLTGNDLAGHIKLELTESVLMQNSGRSLEMFNILHARGLSISIDDFGVGYSSLSRIKRLPIDSLKIDRSFVQNMQHDQASLDIIRAIIDLAYNLKMEVVAEGVETAQQYKLLKRLGCHYAQGYYLSRPLPMDKASDFITQPLQLKE